MNIEVINEELTMSLYGFSGKAINRNYAVTGSRLMDKMWGIIKSAGIENKGMNVWVYEKDDLMFTGVELENISENDTGLEIKKVVLPKYIRYKHIGSYSQLAEVYKGMKEELAKRGLNISLPYLEIYGHWTNDETKLETDIIFSLK